MAIGLGSLIIFLEEGNRNDWFNSGFIVSTGALAATALTLCVAVELRSRRPFVNLRLLARRNFGLASLVGMAFGAGMYGATYLLPTYLAQVQGYNAQQIGQTIMWSGLPQLLMMPIAVVLLKRLDARVLVTFGLIFFAGSSLMNSILSNYSAYDQLRGTQILRAIGMPLVIVPITTVATGLIEADQAGSASALFNMFRNLGGSIGIALLATQLDLREKLHSARLVESITWFRPATAEGVAALAQQLVWRGNEALSSAHQAIAVVSTRLRREALVMAYGDCFFLLGGLLLSMVVFIWFCKPAKMVVLDAH
jgi:DHA2 family multidrug resistance protein